MRNKVETTYIKEGSKYPVGSLVFFLKKNREFAPFGIGHVGIVVGYNPEGVPLIAHAVNSKPNDHLIINRLRDKDNGEKMYYLIAKPPKRPNMNAIIEQVVTLCNRLATKNSSSEPKVKYGHERSEEMYKIVDSLYYDYRLLGDKERFYTVIEKLLNQSKESFASSKSDTREDAWYTTLAKTLNLNRDKSFDSTLFTKGVHCVQAVLFLYQVAFLKATRYDFYDKEKVGQKLKKDFKKSTNEVRFTRKKWRGDTTKTKIHPSAIFMNSPREKHLARRDMYLVRKALIRFLPLDGKITSPAALLMYLIGKNPGPGDASTSGSWSFSWSTSVKSLGFSAFRRSLAERQTELLKTYNNNLLTRSQHKDLVLELLDVQAVNVALKSIRDKNKVAATTTSESALLTFRPRTNVNQLRLGGISVICRTIVSNLVKRAKKRKYSDIESESRPKQKQTSYKRARR